MCAVCRQEKKGVADVNKDFDFLRGAHRFLRSFGGNAGYGMGRITSGNYDMADLTGGPEAMLSQRGDENAKH
jgi:hypothetical protein